MSQYLIFIGLWVIYFSVHSILAMDALKEKFYVNFRISRRIYRLVYSIIATIGLIGIMIYSLRIQDYYLFESGKFLKIISFILSFWGMIILKSAFKQFGLKEFVGLRAESNNDSIHVDGILSRIRHPIYAATILIVIGYVIFIPRVTSFITLSCVLIYLIIGIYLEERKLIKAYGDMYIKYRKEVPALIPRFWK